MLDIIKEEIKKYASEERRVLNMRYFKTGEGQYGYGDIFLGVTLPHIRAVMKPYLTTITLQDMETLLHSKEHEFRLAALLFMVDRYRRDISQREAIVNLYINNTDFVNNWDLVDSSAHHILGNWLEDKDRSLLYDFAKSGELWKERISIIGTMNYVCKNMDFTDALNISEILLHHKHDLIHKAVGWILREVGKRSIIAEEEFLKKYYKEMPRTMLRYAIEKFPEDKRQAYLKGNI